MSTTYLVLSAQGAGHRTIARRLDRPAGTVRGWLRAARRVAPALYRSGTLWTIVLDPHAPRTQPAGSPLGDAVEPLACAARGWRLRFGARAPWSAWELVVALTDGKRPFETRDQSTNNPFVALVGLGEGNHHNHHAFPRSARHGLQRWQFDPTWWLIWVMETMGSAWDVQRVTP